MGKEPVLTIMPSPVGDEQKGHDPYSYEHTLKIRLAELRDLVSVISHRKHSGRKSPMTAQQKAELSMLEMLSGCMYQQLGSWKRDGKEDRL